MRPHNNRYLMYKGQRIRFVVTDKGNLFSIKNLANIIWTYSYTPYSKVSLHNNLFLVVNGTTFRCTGLTGFRELVADRYNDFKDLEELLISNNIIQGDLPAAETLKLVEYKPVKYKGIKAGTALFRATHCAVSTVTFPRYNFFIHNCSCVGGGNKRIDFITEDTEFTTMDRIFFHVNDMLYLLKQDHFIDQYDFVYEHKDLTGTYKLLTDGYYPGECPRKTMFCNLSFFKQVIQDDFAVEILSEIEAGTDLSFIKQNVIEALKVQREDAIKYHKYAKRDISHNNVNYSDVVKICHDIIAPVVEENRRLMVALEQIRAATYDSIMGLLADKQLRKGQ